MKIGFVLLSNRLKPIPSTRVAVLNVLSGLQQAGLQADILHEPDQATETPALPDRLFDDVMAARLDMVVFQKVHGSAVLQLVDRLRAAGVKTAYLVCDLVDQEMAQRTDGTIVVTDFLRELYGPALAHKVHVVHDGIERSDVIKPQTRPVAASRRDPLRAVLVTSAELTAVPVLTDPPDWLDITIVAAYPPKAQRRARFDRARWAFAGMTNWADRRAYLRFLSHPRIHREAWHPDGVYRHLVDADVGIIPIDVEPYVRQSGVRPPAWAVKSENRLTLKMSIGLPVVATPIPAYETVVEQGRNAFLARDRSDWLDCLGQLRDPEARRRIGAEARRSVEARFSIREQTARLARALTMIAGLNAVPKA